jgi:hypothetical protein
VILDISNLPQATKKPAVFPWEALRAELAKFRDAQESCAD